MPSQKPCNAVFKDSVVVFLALKAHFAIADNHPKEEYLSEFGKMMLLHVPNPNSQETEQSKGEYYSACKLFVKDYAAALQAR